MKADTTKWILSSTEGCRWGIFKRNYEAYSKVQN